MSRVLLIGTIILVLGYANCFAHDLEPTYDRISLSASSEMEVENDLLVAMLYAEHQAQKQKNVSDKVNSAIRWAIDTAKKVPEIKVQTMQYSTSPVYSKKVITAWRARQSIKLESTDTEKMSDLIGDLQAQLAIGSVSYAVSKPARDLAEDSLITTAMAQFRRRAELITRDLGRTSYRIVQINVNTQGGRPMPMAYAARGMAAAEKSVAPAIEAGVQTVSVNISGTIELDAQ